MRVGETIGLIAYVVGHLGVTLLWLWSMWPRTYRIKPAPLPVAKVVRR